MIDQGLIFLKEFVGTERTAHVFRVHQGSNYVLIGYLGHEQMIRDIMLNQHQAEQAALRWIDAA